MRIPILPQPGLITDDTGFSNPNRYSDLDCVRFFMGKPQPIGGWLKYFTDQLSGVCRNLLAWFDRAAYENLALGTHTHLYVYLNGVVSDITPTVDFVAGAEHGAGGPGFGAGAYGAGAYGGSSITDYFPLTWSLSAWGENLIANPRMQSIFLWENDIGTEAVRIPNAPDQVICALVSPERQVLAFGCNEEVSGDFNPMCIRGSDLEDYDDWTTTPANNAFEHILEPGGGGRIVMAKRVGSYIAVWTDQGLYQGTFVGDPSQTYRFDILATNCGLLGPNAVQVVNQTAYWISPDYQFYTWTPGQSPQIVGCPIRTAFKDNVATGQFDKIAACSVGQYGEIRWFYPDARDGVENSRYIAMGMQVPNGQSFEWSKGTLARSACIDSGPTRHPIYVSPDGYAYSHEDGQAADGGVLDWSFTVFLPYLEEGGRFVLLKGIEPDIKDQVGAVSMALTLKKYPQSSTTTGTAAVTLAPGAEIKHFMAQGRSGVLTFSGSSSPSFARFGKPVLPAEATGRE